MADSPRPWVILQQLARRLGQIRTAAGYRTDVGERVWLEPAQHPQDEAIGLTLATLAIEHDADRRQHRLRAIIEAALPTTLQDAHATAHGIAADLEDALALPLPLPTALPVQLHELTFLDRPEGLPVIAVQAIVSVAYRA